MDLSGIFEKSQVVADCVLNQLDANSLAILGSCNKFFRSLTNSSILWFNLCKSKGYLKYQYLTELSNHPFLPPLKSNTITPVYYQYDTETLQELDEWRDIYNRAEHLESNWKNGIYFVPPLLKGHKYRITAFDTNGSIIATGSNDEKLIKVWSVEECECVNTIKLKADSVNCILIYKNTLIAAGDDGIIRIYDPDEGDLLFTLLANNSNASASKMIQHKEMLIVVFSDSIIRTWSLNSYDSLHIMRGHEDEVESIFAYENILISGSWDNSIIIWNLQTGHRLAKLEGHTEVINDLKMKENKIVTASSDATLRVWNIQIEADPDKKKKLSVKLRNEPIILIGHASDIYCVQIYNDFICSGGADSSIIVWNFGGDLLHRLNGHLGIVRSLYIDDYKLVSGGDAKKIMIWDYKNGELLNQVHRNPNKLNDMIVTDTNIITVSPEVRNDFFDISIITFW